MNQLINTLLLGPANPRHRFQLTCEPVTISMGVMAAAGAAASIAGQQQAKKTHNKNEEARRLAQEDVIAENRRRTTEDYLTQTRLEMDQQSQEEAAVALKSNDVQRQTQRTIATGTASAAERGVAGRTVDQIASDFDFMSNEETGRLKENQKLANQQHQENIRGYGTQYSNRIADVKTYIPQPAKPVDYFSPIFGAVSQTVSAGAANPDMRAKVSGLFSKESLKVPTKVPYDDKKDWLYGKS